MSHQLLSLILALIVLFFKVKVFWYIYSYNFTTQDAVVTSGLGIYFFSQET